MRWFLAVLAVCAALPAGAQVVTYPPGASTSDLAAVQAMAAAACVATPAVPSAEVVGGSAGTNNGQCRPTSSVQPRITRAANCTLDVNGTCSVTWATALSGTPVVVLTPVNTVGAQPVMCNSTAAPTTTAVSIKCWIVQTTTLNLSIVTAGLQLLPAVVAPSGTVVMITALPTTQ